MTGHAVRGSLRGTVSCTAVMTLPDGALYGQFLLRLASSRVAGAVTGGTGAYANARGVVASRDVRGGSEDTITLVQ